MQVNIKKIDKLKQKLNIELSGEEFSNKKNQFYRDASQKLKVPGFRPGKAPLELIEKHHGKALQQDFINKNLPLIYQQALEEKNIIPAGLPKISDIKIDGKSLSFVAEVEIQPEIEIDSTKYKEIKIKNQKTEPSTKQIDQTIKKFKEELEKIAGQKLEDQKLAKWASYPDMDSFRQAIAVQIHFDNLQKRRRGIEDQIRDYLLNSIKPEVPQAEVERYHQQLVQRQKKQLIQQGIKQEEIDKYKDNFEKKLKPIAEKEVKFYYILKAIAKKEKIKEDQQMANTVIGLILGEAKFD